MHQQYRGVDYPQGALAELKAHPPTIAQKQALKIEAQNLFAEYEDRHNGESNTLTTRTTP